MVIPYSGMGRKARASKKEEGRRKKEKGKRKN
jgi:hypothetical protein